jgi:hypothetical protein
MNSKRNSVKSKNRGGRNSDIYPAANLLAAATERNTPIGGGFRNMTVGSNTKMVSKNSNKLLSNVIKDSAKNSAMRYPSTMKGSSARSN